MFLLKFNKINNALSKFLTLLDSRLPREHQSLSPKMEKLASFFFSFRNTVRETVSASRV
jgi:hypothetical protein